MEPAHQKVFTWLGMVNPQLLLGAAVACIVGTTFLLCGRAYVRRLKSLPPSMQWLWGAWMDEGTLYSYTLVGGVLMMLFSIGMFGIFIAEQATPH